MEGITAPDSGAARQVKEGRVRAAGQDNEDLEHLSRNTSVTSP